MKDITIYIRKKRKKLLICWHGQSLLRTHSSIILIAGRIPDKLLYFYLLIFRYYILKVTLVTEIEETLIPRRSQSNMSPI